MSTYGTKNFANESEKYRKEVGKFTNKSYDKYTYQRSSVAFKREQNSRIVDLKDDKIIKKTNNCLVLFAFLLLLVFIGLFISLVVVKTDDYDETL